MDGFPKGVGCLYLPLFTWAKLIGAGGRDL